MSPRENGPNVSVAGNLKSKEGGNAGCKEIQWKNIVEVEIRDGAAPEISIEDTLAELGVMLWLARQDQKRLAKSA